MTKNMASGSPMLDCTKKRRHNTKHNDTQNNVTQYTTLDAGCLIFYRYSERRGARKKRLQVSNALAYFVT
jgi:hypothetical protein